MVNPYLPPNQAPPPPGYPYGPPAHSPPGYGGPPEGPLPPRLFTPSAIALGTFLGTALTGAALFAWNQRKLGRGSDAWITIALGVGVTAAVFGLALVLPDSATPLMTGVNLGLVFGARALAIPRFDAIVAEGRARGVTPASGWWAVPISLAVAIPAVGLFLVGYAATQETVTVAPGHEITVEGDATEAEAKALGDSFVRQTFMGPQAKGERGVVLRKDDKGYALGFFVVAGSWNESTTVDAFSCIAGRARSDALRDQPTTVELLDEWGIAKKSFPAPSSREPDFRARCGE
jgi:hypothetical protein